MNDKFLSAPRRSLNGLGSIWTIKPTKKIALVLKSEFGIMNIRTIDMESMICPWNTGTHALGVFYNRYLFRSGLLGAGNCIFESVDLEFSRLTGISSTELVDDGSSSS